MSTGRRLEQVGPAEIHIYPDARKPLDTPATNGSISTQDLLVVGNLLYMFGDKEGVYPTSLRYELLQQSGEASASRASYKYLLNSGYAMHAVAHPGGAEVGTTKASFLYQWQRTREIIREHPSYSEETSNLEPHQVIIDLLQQGYAVKVTTSDPLSDVVHNALVWGYKADEIRDAFELYEPARSYPFNPLYSRSIERGEWVIPGSSTIGIKKPEGLPDAMGERLLGKNLRAMLSTPDAWVRARQRGVLDALRIVHDICDAMDRGVSRLDQQDVVDEPMSERAHSIVRQVNEPLGSIASEFIGKYHKLFPTNEH